MLCAVTTTVGVLPTAWLINYPSQVGVEQPGLLLPVIASLACGLFIGVTGPNIRAVLLDSNPPEVRGSVVSLYTLCNDLGMGLGPVVVAALVAWQGRLVALNLANGLWLVAGVVLFAVVRAFPRDERLMQQRLAAIGAGVRAGSPPEP
jgi:MFS-type transporter involved in bile tolerance (Atg22 family)